MKPIALDALPVALKAALGFAPLGAAAGNLTVGRGSLQGRPVHVALVENRVASGAIGLAEAKKLSAIFGIAARGRSPVVLYLDSAGAKVSEELRALGAFRKLYRAALEARLAGAPIVAVLGRNCFGGASMLAHVAPHRLFDPRGRLAMSGPSILASGAGMDPLDEMFRAMADAALSPASRAKANGANEVWHEGMDLGAWLGKALAPGPPALDTMRRAHEAMGARLPKPAAVRAPEPFQRRELDRLYPQGYTAHELDGWVTGSATRDGRPVAILGILARTPVGAERAWRFAQSAWALAADRPGNVDVLLDCESHAAKLDDERIVLSEYIAGMGFALAALAAAGTRVELLILGRAGGGVYVALAAPAHRVLVEHGARVQVLPGAAVAAILGEGADEALPAEASVAAGVADAEIKLGIIDVL